MPLRIVIPSHKRHDRVFAKKLVAEGKAYPVFTTEEELDALKQADKKTEIKKELPNVGISIQKEALTPEQEKIKMLEGILAATEKRLLYYIQQENNK